MRKNVRGGGGEYIVSSGSLAPGEIKDHELRLWLAENSPNSNLGKHFHGKIQVEIVQITGSDASKRPEIIYTDEVLNGADPVLSDNLVPVTIAVDGTVKRADLNRKWYDYTNKVWANAVVLEDSAKEYQVEEVIPEEAIESYFVWIPRYKYKIFNTGKYSGTTYVSSNAVQTIEIAFETKDVASSTGTNKGEWLSHPAFQAFDTNGLWVGKFEPGYRNAQTKEDAQVQTGDASMLVIKPNIHSWRNINIGNAFKTSYEYLRESESHMMKNTEWGAVAYLSHSKYGINGPVYRNNYTAYLTGCGKDIEGADAAETCLNAYGSKNDNHYNQTTTGNISGIFDMNGGATEYVMGYRMKSGTSEVRGGITNLYPDFFESSVWDKYCDKYQNNDYGDYNYRILGDATGELGPFEHLSELRSQISSWYESSSVFLRPDYSWFNRGGWPNGKRSGIFFFISNTGDNDPGFSFRVVLAP